MEVQGCVALVTGANRGLGRAYVDALLNAGASRVYGAARDPATIEDPRVIPVALDVTNPEQIASAALACSDVTLLINNAGILETGALLDNGAIEALERQFAVNAIGPLAMARAFAPVIERNGGGTIVNMLSVVSWFTPPASAAYAASKYAALALTNGLRATLAARGIRVIGVHAGFIDTDMVAGIDLPKASPQSVAEATVKGILADSDHVLADARSQEVWDAMRRDPNGFQASVDADYRARLDASAG